MHSYTVEPLYVKSDHEVIAADFYRPKSIETRGDSDGAWSGGLASF